MTQRTRIWLFTDFLVDKWLLDYYRDFHGFASACSTPFSLANTNYSEYCRQPPPNLPRKITHPDLPKGKEQVTLHLDSSPHLTSPVGEGQLLLLLINH